MSHPFSLSDVYDSNLNFLIGAGASAGLFPTLALNLQDGDGNRMSIESLATLMQNGKEDPVYTAIFMHYYKECIEPVLMTDYASAGQDQVKLDVLKNYETFLRTILNTLIRKKTGDTRVCNIFTTNYDGCFAHAAEQILESESVQFFLNDGTLGFKRKFLDAKNFGTRLSQTGVFKQHRHDLPQINLVHLHGSAYWRKDGEKIKVDYITGNGDRLVKNVAFEKIKGFSETLANKDAKVADLPKPELEKSDIDNFWLAYDKLPIVNPTKWKFHETVFEEHYYQMLRYLSYELERHNTTLIAFGFSFADEHIRNLVRRSLSNPSLQVFVFCRNETAKSSIEKFFSGNPNVMAITLEEELNFTKFNSDVFAQKLKEAPAQKEEV
jgi:hypothetical protein